MALVKCPKHRIPYNDNNPRGCPACAQEKEGGASQVMQELARASQSAVRRSSGNILPPDLDKPVTAQPRVPVPTVDWVARILRLFRNKRLTAVGGGVIALLILVLIFTSGSHFTAAESPANYSGVVRPFPVAANDPISMVFSALGPQPAQPNPTARTLERYSYGTDMFVDALNGRVYAITLSVPNRSWHGLRVGMNQTNAEGALALLGPPREPEPATTPVADTISGYLVYRTLDTRPRRTLVAQVRPPNNCFDVLVDLQPRSLGVLTKGRQKWVVVVPPDGAHEWAVTRIRVISRAMPGPYSGEPVC